MLDRTRLKKAFGLLGEDLARRGLFLEIAVYGGSALVLQFATLEDLYVSIHREAPNETVRRRLVAVLERP